jgi:hypothetical protein
MWRNREMMWILFRCQLITAAGTMIKCDFPSKWPQFINQIHTCLSTDNAETWTSVLLVFYTLVQYYEWALLTSREMNERVAVKIQESGGSWTDGRCDDRAIAIATSTSNAVVHSWRFGSICFDSEINFENLPRLHSSNVSINDEMNSIDHVAR